MEKFLNCFGQLIDCELYKSKLGAIVLTWLEVKDGKPTFQKRVYKKMEKFKEYVQRMFATKSEFISNVQFKMCYELENNKELQ